jgi:hypothetical protein
LSWNLWPPSRSFLDADSFFSVSFSGAWAFIVQLANTPYTCFMSSLPGTSVNWFSWPLPLATYLLVPVLPPPASHARTTTLLWDSFPVRNNGALPYRGGAHRLRVACT